MDTLGHMATVLLDKSMVVQAKANGLATDIFMPVMTIEMKEFIIIRISFVMRCEDKNKTEVTELQGEGEEREFEEYSIELRGR